ncbi:MAG TPA: phosphatase PAP2 family protein [Nitrospirota bacterium]|nr:phosphatase PAP2 family protein [Nitrospirota bacterium]
MAPAAGVLVFQIGHADRNLEAWAATTTPVFRSQEHADRTRNELRDTAAAIWIASGLVTPSGDSYEDWLLAKTQGFGVQAGAGILMRETVGVLKSSTDRTRPNGVDKGSFPSEHATTAALYSTFASRNIETIQLSQAVTTVSQVGLGALTAATAWARVEANQHYPSNVLGGIAFGHFLGVFCTDAFLGLENPRNAIVLIEPLREGVRAMIRLDF